MSLRGGKDEGRCQKVWEKNKKGIKNYQVNKIEIKEKEPLRLINAN